MDTLAAWKTAVATKTADLIARGWKPELAARRARKVNRHLHPSHRAAIARRIEMADIAETMTGKTHTI